MAPPQSPEAAGRPQSPHWRHPSQQPACLQFRDLQEPLELEPSFATPLSGPTRLLAAPLAVANKPALALDRPFLYQEMPTLSLALRRVFQRLSLCSRGSLNHTSELEANNTLGYHRCSVCGEQRSPFCEPQF